MNTPTASTRPAASTELIRGIEYRRTGAPLFHVQVGSWRGGFLSTAAITRNRAYVGDFARGQAEILSTLNEARRPCFNGAILQVTDQETRGVAPADARLNPTRGYDVGRAAVLSCYSWDSTTGRWSWSFGTRIAALDSMEAATTPAWTLAD